MYVKFDRVSHGCKDNKGSCQAFIRYMAKEDKKDEGHPVEWWFDQTGKDQTADYVQERIDEDWQGLGKNATKFTTGSIDTSEREWLAMGDTDEDRLRNFKAWVAEKFTAELAGNFNKHKLPTKEQWLLKGATPEERANKYKKEVAAEIISKYAKGFRYSKPTGDDLKNICTSPNPTERFRAWLYSNFADKVTAAAWTYDKGEEADWLAVAGDNKHNRIKALERETLVSFREKFDKKFYEYMATLGEAGKDVDLFKEWLSETFAVQLAHDFKQPTKKGEFIIITPENVKIYFKLEHNRYYKGDSKEVLQGKAKAGDMKSGCNTHIHFIIATKTADKQHRINPQTKNREEFDRINFFQKVEHSFDKHFGYQRKYEESVAARLGAKLVATTQVNKVNPLSLGKEAFRDRPAEEEVERDELTRGKGKRR